MAIKLDLEHGQYLNFVSREGWGALPPTREFERNKPPVRRVRFAYTGRESCINTGDCMRVVKDLQMFYRNNGKPDLPYNFLVGGDGRVYEAAGWHLNAGNEPSHFWLKGKTVVVAYIGSYVKEDPPYDMISVAMDLIKFGLREKIIDPLFKLVPGTPNGESEGEEEHKPKKRCTAKKTE